MKISTSVVNLLLTLLSITGEYVMAKLTMTQSSSEVIVGGTTRMSCVTTLQKEIYWFHFPAGSSEQRAVYAYGKMHSPYIERFRINITTGFYELTIPRVNITDAGVYTCQEDEGSGDSDQGQLTVLEARPTCASTKNPLEFIGPNSCNKHHHESLILACSVAYRGNIDPQLEWRMVGSNDAVTHGIKVEKTGNRITYHLSIPSQPAFDGSSFICVTTKSQLNCTSDVIKVIYVIGSNFTQKAVIGDTVVCTAKTNESCSYRWKWFKGDDTLTASNNRTLIPKQSGNFRCEAECSIRNESCPITAMFAYVEDGNATYSAEEPVHGASYVAMIVSVVVVVVTVLIIIIILLVLWFTKRRVRKRERTDQLPLMENGVLVVELETDIPKYYTQMPFIDKGSSGEICGPFVFQGNKCACEKIMLTSTDGSFVAEEDVCRQGRLWMELDHENVLKFYDVVSKSPAVFIVMDYAEGGSVRKALNSCTEDLKITMVKDWAMQIADGMNYLHGKNIVHKRLRAAQILIMELFEATDPSPKTLKIASCRLSPDREGQSTQFSLKGLFGWMAPESVRGDRTVKASDVWSYGVTIWEILTREIPHRGVKVAVLIKDLSEGNRPLAIPDRCPDAIRGVLQNCWSKDMERRPTFLEIVSKLHAVPDC